MGKNLKGKELGKGLSQRKDGSYCGRYVNRFGNRNCIYGKTLKEVKNKLASALADDQNKKNVIDEKITLDEWFCKWIEVYKVYVRENTKQRYTQIYQTKISKVLGKRKLNDITRLEIVALLNNISDNGYGWETLNKVRVLLADMFERAVEDEFVYKNPAKGVRLPKNKPQAMVKALTMEEQKNFLECSAGTFYHNLFLVALNTGLRPGELFALTEKDLDFNKKEISISKTLLYQKLGEDEHKEFHMGPPKTKGSIRTVPMNKICENALIKQVIQHNIVKSKHLPAGEREQKAKEYNELIFTTKFGTPLNSVLYSEAIGRIIEEINLTRDELEKMEKFSGHTFRHTFATRCFEANISPKTVQTYLGHASLKMTMDLYTSVLGEKKKEDMKLLEESMDIEIPDVEGYDKKKIIPMRA